MPLLSIQFQPNRVTPEAELLIISAFRDALPAAEIVGGDDDVRYINITFPASSATIGWKTVSDIFTLPHIGRKAANSCIVICQGQHGWNDYQLLHHYDRTLITDSVPPRNHMEKITP